MLIDLIFVILLKIFSLFNFTFQYCSFSNLQDINAISEFGTVGL